MNKNSLLEEQSPSAPAAPSPETDQKPQPAHGPLTVMREWLDALVIAFVLAMFIRIFIVELFKIPTGSMTPTLIGGRIADYDYDRDGRKDMLFFSPHGPALLFTNNGKRLVGEGPAEPPGGNINVYERYDRILVNKLAYWFHPPRRGDIIVFKVPERIWEPDKPIYIKRCVGEPGDLITFDARRHLVANGQRVTQPDFFQAQRYELTMGGSGDNFVLPPITYSADNGYTRVIQSIKVPADEVYAFGDNTWSSRDSRYWGGIELIRVKGRAFFRYVPLSKMKFLHKG